MKKQSFRIPAVGVVLIFFLLLAAQAFAGPVSNFGYLQVCGKNICGSKTGTTPIFLKGPSLFWSDGTGAPYYRPEVVDWFVDNMQIGVIRAAMAIRYYGESNDPINAAGGVHGYYFDPTKQKSLIKSVIDAAIENDIYVVVDWHSHNAHTETNDAKNFFVEMANEYKDVPNIIWEVYNEPMNVGEGQVTSHAKTIVNALRAQNVNNKNLVIIGSPSWSSKPNDQAKNYGTATQAQTDNVAFTFHFYAAEHPQSGSIGTSASNAMSVGYAVFASEWGAVSADGDGNVNTSASDTWTTWMDNNKVSSCMWNASAARKKAPKDTSKIQGSSMFLKTANSATLSLDDLSGSAGSEGSGQYFKTYMSTNKWTSLVPNTHPKGNDVITSVVDGSFVTLSSTQLDLRGDITEVSEVPFGEISISADKKSITYTTSARGSTAAQIKFKYKVTQKDVITQKDVTIQSKVTINITNRRPILPEKLPIAVSRKAPTDLNLTSNLSATDPTGQGLEFMEVTVTPSSMGTTSISSAKNVVTFTPAASQSTVDFAEATLTYTIKSKSGPSNTASVVLQIQNFAPTIRPVGGSFAPSAPNTEPVGIGMAQNRFNGNDKDGDAIWFDTVYLAPQYPGSLQRVSGDSFVYHPDPGKIGKVTFLAIITDGSLKSPIGGLNITLTGNGTDIGNLTPPTEIPGVAPIAYQASNAKGMGLSSLGFGKVEIHFAQSGFAKLDVYSLSGKKIGNLLNSYQNAGSKEISLNALNLQKGVYILRLSQGSQVKTLRVVK